MTIYSQLTLLLRPQSTNGPNTLFNNDFDEIAIVEMKEPFRLISTEKGKILGISVHLLPELWRSAKANFTDSKTRQDAAKILLLMNPENLDAWNCLKSGDLYESWYWTNLIFARHPATSMGFAHKTYLRDKLSFKELDVRKDLMLLTRCSERKGANYFAWTYRMSWLKTLSVKMLEEELVSVQTFIKAHVSDRSAFCYYEALLSHIPSYNPAAFAVNLIQRYPGHETMWCHLRWLVSKLPFDASIQQLVWECIGCDYRDKMDRDSLEKQTELALRFYYWCKAFHPQTFSEEVQLERKLEDLVPRFIKRTKWYP
jgi:hypothetical protein